MANAINLIDGLDGLAAGIVGIAAVAFGFYSYRLLGDGVLVADNPGPLIATITAGVCCGFLPHNFNPARIFMGDAGALFLGLLMAVSTSTVGGQNDAAYSGQSFFFYAPIFIPLVILGVPLFDAAFAIVRRTARRAGVATADKDHLHHRLMRLGHGHRRSVLILWAWTILLSGFVLVAHVQQRPWRRHRTHRYRRAWPAAVHRVASRHPPGPSRASRRARSRQTRRERRGLRPDETHRQRVWLNSTPGAFDGTLFGSTRRISAPLPLAGRGRGRYV